jgi:hypothetical protein
MVHILAKMLIKIDKRRFPGLKNPVFRISEFYYTGVDLVKIPFRDVNVLF